VLGTHPLARLAAEDLSACGVELADALPDRTEPPAVSAVTVRAGDGERTVVSHNAAGVSAPPLPGLPDADVLLLDGHHPALALDAARAARSLGVPVVLDAGSWKPVLAELLSFVDVCACSAAFVSRVPLHIPVVIRTNGAAPVLWRAGGAHGEVAVPPVDARDTVGAGDVWHGAFALAVGRLGRVPVAAEVPAMVEYANRAAAVRIGHEGARAWVEPMRGTAR
jgi:sugar/nucleoside kinase (ribokinase family)